MANIHPNSLKNLIRGFKNGSIPWNKGKKWDRKTKDKMSNSQLLRFQRESVWNKGLVGYKSGEEHYRWITDRTKVKVGDRSLNDPLQKQWRKEVKNRDGWKCKIVDIKCCGKLVSHHILPWLEFPELRYKVNNGITLCQLHHPRKKEDVAKLSPYFQELVASLN